MNQFNYRQTIPLAQRLVQLLHQISAFGRHATRQPDIQNRDAPSCVIQPILSDVGCQ